MTNADQGHNIQRATGFLGDIVRQLRLIWQLLLDPEVPIWLKVIPPAVLIYIISPLDLLPDLVPGLGQLDDLAVLLIGIKLFLDLAPENVVQRLQESGSQGTPPNPDDEVVDTSYRVLDDE